MTGPFGYTWYFLDLDEFQSEYPEYFEEFSDLVWSDEISATSYSYDDYDYYYDSYYDNYDYDSYDYSDYYYDGYYDDNYYDDWDYYYDDYGYDYYDYDTYYDYGNCTNDELYTDVDGDGCDYYDSSPSECGYYDDENSSAFESCCACQGNSTVGYDDDYYSDEPLWFSFIVNEDLNTWAILVTYE